MPIANEWALSSYSASKGRATSAQRAEASLQDTVSISATTRSTRPPQATRPKRQRAHQWNAHQRNAHHRRRIGILPRGTRSWRLSPRASRSLSRSSSRPTASAIPVYSARAASREEPSWCYRREWARERLLRVVSAARTWSMRVVRTGRMRQGAGHVDKAGRVEGMRQVHRRSQRSRR